MNGERSQQVSLGCGTLILIALIVLIFSGGGVSGLKKEVAALRGDVVELSEQIDEQSKEIAALREALGDRAGAER